jgi:hypothetical protein
MADSSPSPALLPSPAPHPPEAAAVPAGPVGGKLEGSQAEAGDCGMSPAVACQSAWGSAALQALLHVAVFAGGAAGGETSLWGRGGRSSQGSHRCPAHQLTRFPS